MILQWLLVQLICIRMIRNSNGYENTDVQDDWPSMLDSNENQWSGWSEWTTCSRNCDGGISKQTRICLTNNCNGDTVRYKICNMQPCTYFEDYRAVQCSEFNNVPYDGRLFNWVPSYDPVNLCALTCRGSILDKDFVDFPALIVQFVPKVKDGTRCTNASLDMCVDGECKRIGCDLKIGSNKKLDICGVCGGDSSSCLEPIYQWRSIISSCSQPCGGGIKTSTSICRNSETDEQVDDELCNGSMKPEDMQFACNTNQCQLNWSISDWSDCSVSCGGGLRTRTAYCVHQMNGSSAQVNANLCKGSKPITEEFCNEIDCPRWKTSEWNQCTGACGNSVRTRDVTCITLKGDESNKCDTKSKPIQSQICHNPVSCSRSNDRQLPGFSDKLIGPQIIPSEATFIAEDWGKCNVSCGDGYRYRNVHCKIYLEFSQTIAKLPDHQCVGPKPNEYDRCSLEPCTHSSRIDTVRDPGYLSAVNDDKVTFFWKEQGYTPCSASCLVGRQESIIKCVREDTQEIVADFRCSLESKPESHIKLCNEQACLPRWNYSDFQTCSQNCGMGIQMRDVSCIHEVSRGTFITVPNNMCPQPQPADRQFCNVLDCPARWQVSGWSKCSRPCGGGYKERKSDCKQVMAQNHIIDRPVSQCPAPKPIMNKRCNEKPCPKSNNENPSITISNSSFIQHDQKKEKITLKIGGSATIFYGTTIKIKCPIERGFNRSLIEWLKDGELLFDAKSPVKRLRNSKRGGTLRIVHAVYKDSGTYTCRASKSTADITLLIKPRQGEFISSEEVDLRRNSGSVKKSYSSSGLIVVADDEDGDDQSHESKSNTETKSLKSFSKKISFQNANNEDSTAISMTTSSNSGFNEKILHGSSSAQRPKVMDIFTRLQASRKLADVFLNQNQNHDDVNVDVDDNNYNKDGDSSTDEIDARNQDNIIVLGKGSVQNLKFFWSTSDWGACPIRNRTGFCNRNVHRSRKVTCNVQFHNTTYVVNKNLCEDAELVEPISLELCDISYCPKWRINDWSDCDQSNCTRYHSALQHRSVICSDNKTKAVYSDKYCLDAHNNSRPVSTQECANHKCLPIWQTGNWSQCHVPCDTYGLQYRSLQCVWFGSGYPALNNCSSDSRPPVVRSCKASACQNNRFECYDKYSTICQTARIDCDNRHFRQLCCKTCQMHSTNKTINDHDYLTTST